MPPTNAEENVNADWNAVSGDAEILNKPTIPIDTGEDNVNADWDAVTGDAEILNKPTIPIVPSSYAPVDAEENVQSNWNEADSAEDSFIRNKPAIPDSVGEENVQSDWNQADNADDAFIQKQARNSFCPFFLCTYECRGECERRLGCHKWRCRNSK